MRHGSLLMRIIAAALALGLFSHCSTTRRSWAARVACLNVQDRQGSCIAVAVAAELTLPVAILLVHLFNTERSYTVDPPLQAR